MHDSRIIAIETSSASGSVAIGQGPRINAERSFSTQTQHARELLPTLALLYQENGWRAGEVEECYLSIGPGSFTGLRVAVTFARHLALATGARLCPVPTLDVIAANALELPQPPARLAVILDAKRSQVFGAIFSFSGNAYRADGSPRLIEPGCSAYRAWPQWRPTSPTCSSSWRSSCSSSIWCRDAARSRLDPHAVSRDLAGRACSALRFQTVTSDSVAVLLTSKF